MIQLADIRILFDGVGGTSDVSGLYLLDISITFVLIRRGSWEIH